MSTRIGYGLRKDQAMCADLEPRVVGEQLVEAGFDGVFLKSPEHAWVVGLRRAGLRVYSSLGIFMDKDIWQDFPQARPITAEGTPAPRQEWYEPAIPTLPELREQRLGEITRLCRELPLDGLWLDFIRWPARWEQAELELYDSSFDPLTLEAFQRDTGINWPPDVSSTKDVAHWLLTHQQDAWFNWRCEQIVSFVQAAAEPLRQYLPDALLGVFVLPWMEHEVVAGFPRANIRIVGQDLNRLADIVDVISPMVYHRLCHKNTDWIAQVTRWAASRSGLPVWPVIEAIEDDTHYRAQEFSAACNAALSASAGALVAFTLGGVLSDAAKHQVWKAL